MTEGSLQTLADEVKKELASSDYALEIRELPSLPDIYPRLSQESRSDAFEPIKPLSRRDTPDDVVLYIHSSGSTGFPKSIPIKHEMFITVPYSSVVEPLKGFKEHYCKSICVTCSSFSHLP
jgi:acyl-CoA synthetase (AMP-forming)/AMP-acid ligase II